VPVVLTGDLSRLDQIAVESGSKRPSDDLFCPIEITVDDL